MHFNHAPALIVTCILTLCVLFIASIVHTYAGVHVLPYNDPDEGSNLLLTGEWLFSHWFRMVVMAILLLGFSQVFSRRKLFLDKNCIHQSDMGLNQGGLLCLPYILSRCKNLVCIVDEAYFNRLWCVYEVAMFMRVSKGGKITFTYSWQCVVFMVVFVFYSIEVILQNFLMARFGPEHYASFSAETIEKDWLKPVIGRLNWGKVGVICLVWLYKITLFFTCRLYFMAEDHLWKLSKSFDARYFTRIFFLFFYILHV